MAQNENYSQVDLRVGTEEQFNAKVGTLPAGTLFGTTDSTVSKADLSTDLKNEINGKINKPANPTSDSAVVMDSSGTVSTKLLSEIGSNITVDSELSDSSENPVQNKVINSALNGKYAKPSSGIPKTDLASEVQTSLGKADSALQSVPSNYVTNTTYASNSQYGVAKIWLDTTDNYLYIKTDGQ